MSIRAYKLSIEVCTMIRGYESLIYPIGVSVPRNLAIGEDVCLFMKFGSREFQA